MNKQSEKPQEDKQRVQSDKNATKELQKIIGSRPVQHHIMYDGFTNIGKKQLSDHVNLKVQIKFNWNDHNREQEQFINSETETKQILPKINNSKSTTEMIQIKPQISLDHQKRYGKFSLRYLQKTNPLGASLEREIENFEASSGKYGKFYMKSNGDLNQLREFDQKYCVIPVEQPILKGFIIRFPFAQQVSIQTTAYLKRSFKEASVEMATNPINPFHQWFIKLDGKSVKTSQRNSLAVPSPQLAACIASEFNHQKDFLNFSSMPLMILARNAIDLDYDATNREMIKSLIITTLENDPILNRKENQVDLQQIQQQELEQQLRLFNQKFGMTITLNDGIENKELKFQDKVKIESIINGLNNWQLVSLNSKIENLKSCILAIHLTYGLINMKKAISLAKLTSNVDEKLDNEENFIETNLQASQLFSQLIYSQSIVYK